MAAGAQVIDFPRREPATEEASSRFHPVKKLKGQLEDYLGSKTDENREAQEADRYFHSVQWDDAELSVLRDRNQPAVTFNRIKRKVNTVCGILERARQDPKAYPIKPSPGAEDGAELATKVLRHMIGWNWVDLSSTVARKCAVRAIAGIEFVLVTGENGDPDIEMDEVDQRDYFYDPRSKKPDFSDVRFEGTTRWIDLDEAKDRWPDAEDELDTFVERSPAYSDKSDTRNLHWFSKDNNQIRIVDHWYRRGDAWYYCIYAGDVPLEEGESPFRDEKGKSCSKFLMFSCEIDHDNDRYSFFRDWKGPQDEINHRRSKGLWALNTRRVSAEKGAVDDVDKARREVARTDGWIERNKGYELEILTNDHDVEGNLSLLQDAKAEIDTYGPNPGLIGTEVDASSGRAVALLQAAGIAEMGTYIIAYRHWKLRVYRRQWANAQTFWQGERWIRVTDQEGMAEFVQVNGWEQDPMTGQPVVINSLAQLDVEIVIDEGPDAINSQADTFDTLMAMAAKGSQVPPQVIIQLSNLPSTVKKQLLDTLQKAQQPNPMDQTAIQLKLEQIMAQIQKDQSVALLNQAKAAAEGAPETGAPVQIDTAADMAKARLDLAKAAEIEHKIAGGGQEAPSLFDVEEQQARTRLTHAKALESEQKALTIAQAPPGMLNTPPPRPPGGAGARPA